MSHSPRTTRNHHFYLLIPDFRDGYEFLKFHKLLRHCVGWKDTRRVKALTVHIEPSDREKVEYSGTYILLEHFRALHWSSLFSLCFAGPLCVLHHLTPLLTLWNFYLCSAAATDCCAKTWRIPPTLLVLLHLLHPSVDTSLCLSGFSLFETVDRQGPTFLSTEKLQGGQISTLHDKLLMTPLALLFFPPEASCWGTLRENQSLRGLSLHLCTLQMGSYMTTHIYNLHALYEILLEIVQNTHTQYCVLQPKWKQWPLEAAEFTALDIKNLNESYGFFLGALIWALLGLRVLSGLKEKFKSHSQPEKKLVGQKHQLQVKNFCIIFSLKGRLSRNDFSSGTNVEKLFI